MKHLKLTIFALLAALLIGLSSEIASATGTKLILNCEYAETPLGIDVVTPRLMWKIDSQKSGYTQKNYRLLVASSPEKLKQGVADVWDSGNVKSEEQIVYTNGIELQSHTRYWWFVEVWGTAGRTVSEPSWFETGMMAKSDWQAKWITDSHDMQYEPAPRLRKEFSLKSNIASARCYISGIGYYTLKLNGERVGNQLLDPGFTDFGKRVLYVTHDVTEQLKSGANAVAVELGNGWFNEQTATVWDFHVAPWRARPRMVCEIHVTYLDGSKEIVCSDDSWRSSTGPIRFDNLHVGTTYDARFEQPGWDKSGFDDSKWEKVTLTQCPAPILEAQKMPAIGYSELVTPISIKKMHETSYVFDMGINFAGVCRLRISGPRGASVTLKHAEMLDANGYVDQRNINMHLRPRNAREVIQTDIYVLKGEGIEEFTPEFTYHGFRYVQVTLSQPMELDKSSLTGVVMHSMVDQIGSFECSNDLLNNIMAMCKRSYLSNLFSIPTDCPTREKNGWMADGFMVQEAGMIGYDSRNIYAKWVKDMTDAQEPNGNVPGIVPTSWRWDSNWAGPIWDAAIFVVPDLLHRYSGDVESMKVIYPTAKRYLEYLKSIEEPNGLLKNGLADWLYYKAQTPSDFMTSCYYYYDNVTMAKMAMLTGNEADAPRYLAKAEMLKKQINQTFYNKADFSYSNKTQLAYALPLYMGIAPQEDRVRIAAELNRVIAENDYSLDFGFIGSLIVPDVLSEFGYAETFYKMATKTTLPSWGYWIKQSDATSLFETWDHTRHIGDASLNHPSMGAIAAWMYRSLAGINCDPQAPGFKKIVIKPAFPEGLDWVRASYDSQQGVIKSEWKREEGKVTLKIEIPAGATARVVMPNKTYENVKSGEHTYSVNL